MPAVRSGWRQRTRQLPAVPAPLSWSGKLVRRMSLSRSGGRRCWGAGKPAGLRGVRWSRACLARRRRRAASRVAGGVASVTMDGHYDRAADIAWLRLDGLGEEPRARGGDRLGLGGAGSDDRTRDRSGVLAAQNAAAGRAAGRAAGAAATGRRVEGRRRGSGASVVPGRFASLASVCSRNRVRCVFTSARTSTLARRCLFSCWIAI